jgi:hypothetical protein
VRARVTCAACAEPVELRLGVQTSAPCGRAQESPWEPVEAGHTGITPYQSQQPLPGAHPRPLLLLVVMLVMWVQQLLSHWHRLQ